MKKFEKIAKNNRGAALISVMIAVAFIAILASTLLYMSYNNFKMKVVNYESKVNFYETESELTTITTSIRNEIANSNKPLDTLKATVGCHEISPGSNQYRYNPKKLAALIDNTITVASTELDNDHVIVYANGDKTSVKKGTGSATTPNFLIYTKTGANNTLIDGNLASNEQKIVLKDVVVEHLEADNGYINKLETDIVFRVSTTPSSATPGGVGEFSVLADSPINTGGNSTRITFYGNSFIGPGTYAADPTSKTALTLDGDSYLAQKGEYMIVYGNIYLNDRAVLHVAEGSLTVFGNIYINGNAVLMCGGNLFLMDGCNIVNNTGKANSVLPNDLAPQTVTTDSYNNVKGALGLDDADSTNDGIVNQIVKSDMKEKIEEPGNFMENKSNCPYTDLQGIRYHVYFWKDTDVNNKDVDGSLCFLKEGSHKLQDGANRNTTFISFAPISFYNDKNPVLTQMGSAAFDYLTTSGSAGDLDIIIEGSGGTKTTYKLSSFFNTNPTPNEAVNKLINNSVNGGDKQPIVDTAVGYENWTKE